MTVVRRIWPVAALFAVTILAQSILLNGIVVDGHAAEHLQSATAAFMVSFLAAVIVWGVGPARRRDPIFWVLIGVLLLGAVGIAWGNLQVVRAIDPDVWSIDDAERLGPTREGFEAGHLLAQRAAYATMAAAVVLALYLGLRHAIVLWAAGVAVVLTVLIPSWIAPGAGLVVLAIALTVTRARTPGPTPAPS